MENYLPNEALAAWIQSRPSAERPRLRQTLAAYKALPPEVSAYHNMKRGLDGDAGRVSRAFEPYANEEALRRGFHRDVGAEAVAGTRFHWSWLRDTGATAETDELVRSLVGWV